MEELLRRLVIAYEEQSRAFPWSDVISSAISFIAILVSIGLWQKERNDRNRPYLQISFELVRSTLACIVLRNVGDVPLVIRKLLFNDKFTKQLPEKVQKRLIKMSDTNIAIYPGQKWVISFDVNVFDILEKYQIQEVKIEYEYCRHSRKKRYKENTQIDFSEYSGILVYISDVDEFKNSVDKLSKTLKGLEDTVGRITTVFENGNNYGQECD